MQLPKYFFFQSSYLKIIFKKFLRNVWDIAQLLTKIDHHCQDDWFHHKICN
jgi:hypothetical protein